MNDSSPSVPLDSPAADGPGIIRNQAPAQSLIGYVIDVGHDDGSGRVWLDVGPEHLNRNGVVHGGIVATLLDSASGFAAARRLGGAAMTPVVTVSLTTQFVAAAQGGQKITAIARYSGGGRKIAHVTAEVLGADGTLIATATGVFKKIPDGRSS